MGSGSESISIHPDEIKAQAPAFATQSDNLANALHKLQSALDGLGACWGADKQGHQFGAAYTPQRDKVTQTVTTLVKGLNSIHEGLTAHAGNHAETDRHNAGNLRNLH